MNKPINVNATKLAQIILSELADLEANPIFNNSAVCVGGTDE